MKLNPLFCFLVLLGCTPKPDALQFGKDACTFCKMTLSDKRFGAELVTIKGKVFKFDDSNCMINYLNENQIDDRELAFRLIIDYSNEKMIEADNAFYMKSKEIRTPMNSQIAAFASYDTMTMYKRKMKGIYLSWGELVTQFK